MTVRRGQHYRNEHGGIYKVLRTGSRSELGLPSDEGLGEILPRDGLVEILHINPEPQVVHEMVLGCMTKVPKPPVATAQDR